MSTIKEIIFEKYYSGERAFVPFGDFPKDLLPTDSVSINVEEAFYTENNSSDGATYLRISRIREKTEEEKDKDRKFFAELREKSRKERYEQYQKLKKEFKDE